MDLFGLGSTGVGATGAAGLGAEGAAGGIGSLLSGLPLQIILPLLIGGIGSIFGGGGDEEVKNFENAQNMKKLLAMIGYQQPYQSPMLSQMDPIVAQALINNMKRYSNFGMPEGMQVPTDFLNILGSGNPNNPNNLPSRRLR